MRELGITYTRQEREALGLPPRRPHAVDRELSAKEREAAKQDGEPRKSISSNGSLVPSGAKEGTAKRLLGNELCIEISLGAGRLTIAMDVDGQVVIHG
jgi:hypothetical protein